MRTRTHCHTGLAPSRHSMGDELLVRVHYLGWRDVWDEEARPRYRRERGSTRWYSSAHRDPIAAAWA